MRRSMRRSMMGRSMMGAAAMFLVLLVLFLVFVRQHVCANGTSYHSADGAQGSSTELMSHESAASASDQCGTETAFTFSWASGASRCSRRSRRTGLPMLALSVLAFLMALLRCVPVFAVALWRRCTVLLLRRLVGRVAAIRFITLVVIAIALLLGWGLMRTRWWSAVRTWLLGIGTVAALAVLVMGWLLAVLRRLRGIVVVALLLPVLLVVGTVASVVIVATHLRYRKPFSERSSLVCE